jgi:hypothetical protein
MFGISGLAFAIMPCPPAVVAVHALAQRRKGKRRRGRGMVEGGLGIIHMRRGRRTTGVGIPPVLVVLATTTFHQKKKNQISIFP